MKMQMSIIDDPIIVQKVYEMKKNGIFISDIAKKLSDELGVKITQMSICRTLNNKKNTSATSTHYLDYPSRIEIENLFSELLQKENDLICIYGGEKLKRKLMIRILNLYLYKEFTYQEVKINLNQWVGESGFYQHWMYLSEYNFIEKVDNSKFKFCDRVKKWKNFGQV